MGLKRFRNLPAIGYFYSPFSWDAVRIFPPACLIFSTAVFEADWTLTVRGLVSLPVPRSFA